MSRFGKAAKKLSVAGFRPARPIDGEFHEHNYAGATFRQLVVYCSICFIAGMAFAVGLGGLLLMQTGHWIASEADKKVADAAATAGVDLSLMTVSRSPHVGFGNGSGLGAGGRRLAARCSRLDGRPY